MKAELIVEELMENPELALDFDAGRVDVKKLVKELKTTYELDGIDATPVVYSLLNTLLSRQIRFTENPEIIMDFGVGFEFEKLQYLPSSVKFALLILKGEGRLSCIKLSMDSDLLIEDLKSLYGNQINETVYIGTPWREHALKICSVYSNYHGKYIPSMRAVRVYNTETKTLDWVYEEYSVEPVYSPKGFRLIEKQARWAYNRGYVPKSEIVRSKWIGNWVWKYDDDYVCVGNDYVPVQDVEKYFLFVGGKYYRRKNLTKLYGFDHWGNKMFRPSGVQAIKEKIKAQYKGLTIQKVS